MHPINGNTPSGRRLLIWDDHKKTWFVAEKMTAIEDGTVDWVYARRVGPDALAFIVMKPTHWMELPEGPGD